MRTLSIDIETYSSADLAKTGVYRYAEAPDFEVLLIGYSIDEGPVKVLDLTEPFEHLEEFRDALMDPAVTKYAYNASFERTCLAKWSGEELPPEQWKDTMIMALECGLPGSLAAAGTALGLPEEQLKDPRGKALIQYFCKPCRPTRVNGGRTRNLPKHDPEKWALFIEYNRQDVVTEMAIRKKLEKIPVPASEWELWHLDQTMNDRGIRIDLPMADNIVRYDEQRRAELLEEAREITGLSNPNSLAQLKPWIEREGMDVPQLRKDDVEALLKREDLPPEVRRVLEIRQALGKTSTAKYGAMQEAVCKDGRLRGILQFYGANRSGRWAGRIVQVHNLAKNFLPDLDLARELAEEGDFDTMETLFGETAFVFSELIRTAFIPSEGRRFVVSDFSAIEARVVAWLAGEQWTLDAFKAGEDIYCKTASMMYHVPVEKHGQNKHLRQKGKIAVLACIAEGQLVLTDQGLVPIEQVTRDMKLWDGVEWVSHGGVIYKGRRKVISYGGLEATEDHIVWTKVNGTCKPIRFGDAAASGSRLIQSGAGRNPIWLALHNFSGTEIHEGVERVLCPDGVHGMRTEVLDEAGQHDAGQDQRLPELQPAEGCAALAGPEIHGGEAEMREPGRSAVQELWRAGDPLRVSERDGRLPLHDRDERAPGQEAGDRPDRQQWELRSGKPQVGDQKRAEREQAWEQEVRVYDILNAGPRHRFTVSGVLVHNCGYQGGVGAMKAMDRGGSIPEEELQSVVDQWRAANPHIVKLWRTCEMAARTAIEERRPVRIQGGRIVFHYTGGNLLIALPSGRRICYWGARIEDTHAPVRGANGRYKYRVYVNKGSGWYSVGDTTAVSEEQAINNVRHNQHGDYVSQYSPGWEWSAEQVASTKTGSIVYMGTNQVTKQWGKTETYGGKLVENIVQATARDCLAEAMRRVTAMGYEIVMHVHDEMIVDVPIEDRDALERINKAMGDPIDWAPGLPLKGDGYTCNFYMKD